MCIFIKRKFNEKYKKEKKSLALTIIVNIVKMFKPFYKAKSNEKHY